VNRSTRNRAVPFWIWNKRKSPMTMTPARVASRKAPLQLRVLRSLSGVPLYRRAEKRIRVLQRLAREREWRGWGYQ
jgi:hypothetical protein